jgi:signal transduction histidine kinase
MNISATKRLITLLDEMLAYSKAPAVIVREKRAVAYLNTVLEQVIRHINVPPHFQIRLPDENHEINTSVIALEQIFMNLFTNAIRYNDKAEGLIAVRFNATDTAYHLEVADNGIGIAKQYHEKIFGTNFTLKITDRFNKKGTGIGLSTVKDLLKVLGGSIIYNQPWVWGTTFFINIPR